MIPGLARRVRGGVVLLVVACAIGSACAGGGVFKREYEYEEELYLALDGSATLNVNASVASLAALRGAPFDPDPLARIDRDALRQFFGAPDVPVSISLARRDGRRFVHASVDVDDVRQLSRLAPFAWSEYRFDRRGESLEFEQRVGPPPREHPSHHWTGKEIVAFRMHLPSEVIAHNAPAKGTERGNILEWPQPLADRLDGKRVDIRVQLEPTSILLNTMLLFGGTALAAVATLGAVIWWISRRGAEA